jgi:hypothetical protein
LQQLPVFLNTRLVGGTAAALQIGHRGSIDLVFFGEVEDDGLLLLYEFQKSGYNCSLKHNTKNIKTFVINSIKVDVVNYPFQWLEQVVIEDEIRLAGLKDISAMKMAAITNRGTKKDFIDMFFLLKKFQLNEMLEFYKAKYRTDDIYTVVRSLSYFADAEENPMPKMFADTSWDEIKGTIRNEVVKISI